MAEGSDWRYRRRVSESADAAFRGEDPTARWIPAWLAPWLVLLLAGLFIVGFTTSAWPLIPVASFGLVSIPYIHWRRRRHG
jgi:hypothetical protein